MAARPARRSPRRDRAARERRLDAGLRADARRGPQRHADPDSVYRGLLDDADLLEDEVWRISRSTAGRSCSNAGVWVAKTDVVAAGLGPHREPLDARPAPALAEGRLDRERLLDASLDALTRDFRPSMVGWYSGLHEALEPTEAERYRVDRYLALLTSPVPVVVNGVAALRTIEELVPSEALAAHAAVDADASPAEEGGHRRTSALAGGRARDPEARPAVLETVAGAPGHERSDVQRARLGCLDSLLNDAPARCPARPRRDRPHRLRTVVEAPRPIAAAELVPGSSRSTSLTPRTGPRLSGRARRTHAALRPFSSRWSRSTS